VCVSVSAQTCVTSVVFMIFFFQEWHSFRNIILVLQPQSPSAHACLCWNLTDYFHDHFVKTKSNFLFCIQYKIPIKITAANSFILACNRQSCTVCGGTKHGKTVKPHSAVLLNNKAIFSTTTNSTDWWLHVYLMSCQTHQKARFNEERCQHSSPPPC